MHGSLKNLILLFLLFITIGNNCAADSLRVNEKTQEINVAPFSEIFIDTQNHFSYDDVSQGTFSDNFKPVNTMSISGTAKKGTVWLRFVISNEHNGSFLGKLEIPIVWLNKTEVYLTTSLKESSEELETINLSQKQEINARSFFIPIEMQALQKGIVYIKAYNTSGMVFAPKLYSKEKAEMRSIYIAMLNGALIGIVLVMFVYNLNNYRTLKDKNYLYYLFYLVGLLFLAGTYYGYNLQIIWQSNYTFNENIYYPMAAFNFLTALLLSRSFLKTDTEYIKIDKYLLVLAGLSMGLAIFGLMSGKGAVIAYATLFFTLLIFLFLIAVSALSIKKQISGSVYFLFAWLFFLAANLVFISMILGIIDFNDFVYDFYAVLVVLNILMISFAMVSRIKDEEMQCSFKVEKEQEVANKLNMSKKELSELNEKLQRKVVRQEKELAVKSKEYEKFSIQDEITKLYNKIKLEEILTNELHRAKRYNYEFSIIVINIDGMKEINDTHGYEVGNSVMKEMGELFIQHIRYLDTVGRWSESEYLIVCPQTNSKHTFIAAEHLQNFVESNKFFFVGKVTASFGVTDYQVDDTPQEIIKRAYGALAKAKEGGKNRVEIL